jgi:hypothetical protein
MQTESSTVNTSRERTRLARTAMVLFWGSVTALL